MSKELVQLSQQLCLVPTVLLLRVVTNIVQNLTAKTLCIQGMSDAKKIMKSWRSLSFAVKVASFAQQHSIGGLPNCEAWKNNFLKPIR
jgi:hypothetical protein